MNAGELINYSSVEQMAEAYRVAVAKITEAAQTIGEQSAALADAFSEEYRYTFDIGLYYHSTNHDASEAGLTRILDHIKRDCWGKIIEKLNIRRLMSSKRVEALNQALAGKEYGDEKTNWPDITPEAIERVAQGYLMSATDFLEEAIAEEYDFWRPQTDHMTNEQFWKLNRKLIKTWMVDTGYGGQAFRCNYGREKHITALDNIMHMLDGKGPVESYKGELASAIETSEDGRGETTYFRFKCYRNGNLHLEFRRQDLLDLFNQIAAKRDRLPGTRRT